MDIADAPGENNLELKKRDEPERIKRGWGSRVTCNERRVSSSLLLYVLGISWKTSSHVGVTVISSSQINAGQ